ncbi:hypothetical protein FB451DRAFT_1189210 [Mycena latifolia]|nr:hypothetical protein FB451DRAFT_1189210 [Mycena latifolia]
MAQQAYRPKGKKTSPERVERESIHASQDASRRQAPNPNPSRFLAFSRAQSVPLTRLLQEAAHRRRVHPARPTPPRAPPTSLPFGGAAPTAGTAFGTPAAGPSSAAAITDPARLPLAQAFTAPVRRPRTSSSRASRPRRSMRIQPRRTAAVRLRARRGTRAPSIPVAQPGALPRDASGDPFVSISARPELAGHSVEIFPGGPTRANSRLPAPGGMISLGQPNPLATPAAVDAFAPQAPTLFGAPQAAQGFPFGGVPAHGQPNVFGAPPQQPATVQRPRVSLPRISAHFLPSLLALVPVSHRTPGRVSFDYAAFKHDCDPVIMPRRVCDSELLPSKSLVRADKN